MSESVLSDHKLVNALQTGLLLGGMGLLLAMLGWTVLGPDGVIWTVLLGLLMLALTPRISSRMVLRMYRAREIDPYTAGDLYGLLTELARRAGLAVVPRLYYVPSRVLNAFAVGHREDAAIGVTDGLLRSLRSRELAGVLAHEVSHIRHNDMRVMGLADMVSRLTSGLSLAGQILLLISIPLILLGVVRVSLLPIFLLIIAPTLSSLLQLGLSRTREYDADLGAAELTGDPQGLASALHKLERLQGGWMEQVLFPGRRLPDPSLLRSHPPTAERVRRLLELAPRPHHRSVAHEAWHQLVPMDPFPNVHRAPRRHWHGLWF